MTDESTIHFKTARAGTKKLRSGPVPAPMPAPPERIPRISRLMALAIHFDGLIRRGSVRDYADVARLGGVSRARITQIMNLLNLTAEIQEILLFLPRNASGRDPVNEHEIRTLVSMSEWKVQTVSKTCVFLKSV